LPSQGLLRGAALSDAPVAVPLRPRRAPGPGSPEAHVAQATAAAERIVGDAAAEAERLLEAAYREGLESGRAAAREELAGTLEALRSGCDQLADHAARLEEEAVAEATLLAVEVAARILRAEVAARPERVSEVVRGAIRRAGDRSTLVARVHPDDLAACRATVPEIVASMGGISRLEVVDDPRVTAGSCVLETAAGDVDATFESQLGRVLRALLQPVDDELVEPPAA
jgi:flagellar assembly protein FliH